MLPPLRIKLMSDKPKISIVTASKNGARFLRNTIESILAQSFTNYEHIVVDSCSTDGTIDILKEYKHIRWISESDRHADEGFYKAAHLARGEYIMLSCVSDLYQNRDWFSNCVEVLDNDPEVSLVYGLAQNIREDGTPDKVICANFCNNPPPQKKDFLPFWLGTFTLCPENTFCIRANIFRECFPRFAPTGCFFQNHALLSLNYNFNINGYLPYFLPVVASCGRYHFDSNSVKLAKLNRIMKVQYRSAIIRYADKLLYEGQSHFFRDGQSNCIDAINFDNQGTFRKKVMEYRINRKASLGKIPSGTLSSGLRKSQIILRDFLLRTMN